MRKGTCGLRFEFHLPGQQTRQQQVARPAEVLDLQMQLVDEAEARRDDGGELVEQRARRLGNLEIVEALLLHALATGCAGHAFDGDAAKLVAAGEAIDELWR